MVQIWGPISWVSHGRNQVISPPMRMTSRSALLLLEMTASNMKDISSTLEPPSDTSNWPEARAASTSTSSSFKLSAIMGDSEASATRMH